MIPVQLREYTGNGFFRENYAHYFAESIDEYFQERDIVEKGTFGIAVRVFGPFELHFVSETHAPVFTEESLIGCLDDSINRRQKISNASQKTLVFEAATRGYLEGLFVSPKHFFMLNSLGSSLRFSPFIEGHYASLWRRMNYDDSVTLFTVDEVTVVYDSFYKEESLEGSLFTTGDLFGGEDWWKKVIKPRPKRPKSPKPKPLAIA